MQRCTCEKFPLHSVKYVRGLCIFSMDKGLSLKEWGVSPDSVVVIHQSSKYSNLHTSLWEVSHSEPGCWSQSAELQGSSKGLTLDNCLWVFKRVGFNHNNFSSWPQFRAVTASESLIRKMLLHLCCYSDTKNKFPKLFTKTQELGRQFLGTNSVFLVSSERA